MILVDVNEENVVKKKQNLDLLRHIKGLKVQARSMPLPFGDLAFEGKGPNGEVVSVGIERKGLHDMLHCIEDGRFSGHQAIGMRHLYDIRILMLEGHWRAHEDGFLMEGFNNGMTWAYCKTRSQRVMYAKLYRYLISVRMAGFIVEYTRDPFHTAYNTVEWFHYWQKADHVSMMQMHELAIPTVRSKPTLTRKWANAIDTVGMKLSAEAAKVFKTPFALANSDEADWLKIKGIGPATAHDIYREIHGLSKQKL